MGTGSSNTTAPAPSGGESLFIRGVSAEMFSKTDDCEACRDAMKAARDANKNASLNAKNAGIYANRDAVKSSSTRDSRSKRKNVAIVVKEADADARLIREDSKDAVNDSEARSLFLHLYRPQTQTFNVAET